MKNINFPQIIDANINRVAEGLRVIEEYCRFVAGNKKLTDKLSLLRKKLNQSESDAQKILDLNARDTIKDLRAKEKPAQRKELYELLKANFKRIEEGLRVLEEYTGNSLYNELRYEVYELEKEMLLNLLKKPITKGIYLISDDPKVLEQGLKWGVSLIQLRAKDKSKSEILTLAKQMKIIATKYKTPFIINDYLDITQIVDADGLHTGQDDLPIPEIRKLLGPHKIIGRTTHNLAQGLKAQTDGADYVSVGPIWETPSKPGREGIGFEYLKQAKEKITIPYVAIGGINLKNCQEVIKFGPPLIGVIRDWERIPEILAYLVI